MFAIHVFQTINLGDLLQRLSREYYCLCLLLRNKCSTIRNKTSLVSVPSITTCSWRGSGFTRLCDKIFTASLWTLNTATGNYPHLRPADINPLTRSVDDELQSWEERRGGRIREHYYGYFQDFGGNSLDVKALKCTLAVVSCSGYLPVDSYNCRSVR